MKAVDVYEYGEARGYGEKKLQRALKKIGGISEKTGFHGAWWWKLPGCEISEGDGMSGDSDEL